jgi:hypothetical protein
MDAETKKDVFAHLKSVLTKYAPELNVAKDQEDDYYLDAGIHPRTGKPTFFGAAQIKKNYVSFHLMPVYIYPELLDGVSAELRSRMQGKSCFNFKKPDRELFDELAALAERGYARYSEDGLLPT